MAHPLKTLRTVIITLDPPELRADPDSLILRLFPPNSEIWITDHNLIRNQNPMKCSKSAIQKPPISVPCSIFPARVDPAPFFLSSILPLRVLISSDTPVQPGVRGQ